MLDKVGFDQRASLERIKISCLSRGLRVTPEAMAVLVGSQGPTLTLHEYPTTGGLTVELPGEVYLNAPFDETFCGDAEVRLETDGAGALALVLGADLAPVLRVLPLPGYLEDRDSQGRLVREVTMSHVDRVRVSPVTGCVYDCGFCDFPGMKYGLRSPRQLVEGLRIAQVDPVLPVRHVLISGGSPARTHYGAFEEVVWAVVAASSLPVDLMMSPMVGNLDFLDRMVACGLAGFAINLELHSPEAGLTAMGGKYRATRSQFAETVGRAVKLLGAGGRVRSLIIPGLEPMEETLRGVEALAALGCHPTLSPFRPAAGTRLAGQPPPSAAFLSEVLDRSRAIVARHGVRLGPDCVPCQHNTLAFPWDLE